MELSTADLTALGADVEYRADPYTADYETRRQAGAPSPIDRANAAVESAEQAAAILSESDYAHRAQVHAERIRERAALTARAQAAELESHAERLAERCEAEVAHVRAFDSARFEGLAVAQPFDETRNHNHGRVGRYS